MMTTIHSYMQLWKNTLRRYLLDPGVHKGLRIAGYLLSGFLLSAASLSNHPQPLCLGLICALTGSQAALTAVGSALGYLVFWWHNSWCGLLWCGLGLAAALTVGNHPIVSRSSMLMPALAGLAASLTGLWLQHLGQAVSLPMYLLHILLAIGSGHLFSVVLSRRDCIADWLACGAGVLALCQVVPIPWLSLGYPAAAALTAASAFPGAALAGLALDLADVTPVPMTAVLCLAWLTRLLFPQRRWLRGLAPGLLYPVVMGLSGSWDLTPVPGLLLGGAAGLFLPGTASYTPRRGEVGVAQVRLELVSSVFRQMQQTLLELSPPPIDEQALLLRASERACGTCTNRKNCTGRAQLESLSPHTLSLPILDSSLHISCRKTGRVMQELRRSQEQLRLLRASRKQLEESRSALTQQYRFLAEYLQELSDELSRRPRQGNLRFTPEVAFRANRAMEDNGDRCLSFPGTGGMYYVAILDGMGTGIGALDEAARAGTLLKQLLTAGFPAPHALSTLNSLCALRSRAGAVTIDLAQLHLDSGKVLLYKWGAAPSYVIRSTGYEKIGTAGPPPGLLVADSPEAAQRLSLRRGEMLVLLSDGVGGEDALRCYTAADEPFGEIAARILECGSSQTNDDATVALIRLNPKT